MEVQIVKNIFLRIRPKKDAYAENLMHTNGTGVTAVTTIV